MLPLRTNQLRVVYISCGISLFESPPHGDFMVVRHRFQVLSSCSLHQDIRSSMTSRSSSTSAHCGVPKLFITLFAKLMTYHAACTPRPQGFKFVMKSRNIFISGFCFRGSNPVRPFRSSSTSRLGHTVMRSDDCMD